MDVSVRMAIVALVACRPMHVAAQGLATVAGHVVDSARGPVAGARIIVDSHARTAQSDLDGSFEVRGLPAGAHRLTVTRIGYYPTTLDLNIRAANTDVVVVLTPIPYVLDSVRVAERSTGLAWSVVLVDQLRQPVTGAEVAIVGSREAEHTDADGRANAFMHKPGNVVLRIRKVGYEPVLTSLRLLGPRQDTVEMARLAASLPPALVMERSGFGRDTFAFRELDTRVRWRGTGAALVSHDELQPLGRASLCDALPLTPSGVQAGLSPGGAWCGTECVLIDGNRPGIWPLAAIFADQVETVEYFPTGSDWSGSISSRCGTTSTFGHGSIRPSRSTGGFVVWLRKGVQLKR